VIAPVHPLASPAHAYRPRLLPTPVARVSARAYRPCLSRPPVV